MIAFNIRGISEYISRRIRDVYINICLIHTVMVQHLEHIRKCQEIRYEDLVTNPDKSIKEACAFLDINYNSDILDHTSQVEKLGDTDKSHHANLSKPISSESIGKWKHNLSESDQESITRLLQNSLHRLGYVD